MEKLKVGDKVQVTAQRCGHKFDIGTTVIVTAVNTYNYTMEDEHGQRWFLIDDEVMLLKPPQFAQPQPAVTEPPIEEAEPTMTLKNGSVFTFVGEDGQLVGEKYDPSLLTDPTVFRDRDDAHLRPVMWPNGAGSLLPKGSAERKDVPIATGVLDYFPAALVEVARVSKVGSEQHHPGQPVHWERGKSMDQANCLIRHFAERGTRDADGERHSAKVAWRALALLQLECEADGAPMARGAK